MGHTTKALMLVLAVLLAIPAASFAGNGNGNGGGGGQGHQSRTDEEGPDDCVDEEGRKYGSVDYTGPTYLWPPNHKDHGGSLTFAVEESGTDVDIIFTAYHDQMVDGEEMNGSGNTDSDTDIQPNGAVTESHDDVADEVVIPISIRSERSGQDKTGRTYYLNGRFPVETGDQRELFGVTFTAPDNTSYTCDFMYTICVPHDMGQASECTEQETTQDVEDTATAVMSLAS